MVQFVIGHRDLTLSSRNLYLSRALKSQLRIETLHAAVKGNETVKYLRSYHRRLELLMRIATWLVHTLLCCTSLM